MSVGPMTRRRMGKLAWISDVLKRAWRAKSLSEKLKTGSIKRDSQSTTHFFDLLSVFNV